MTDVIEGAVLLYPCVGALVMLLALALSYDTEDHWAVAAFWPLTLPVMLLAVAWRAAKSVLGMFR